MALEPFAHPFSCCFQKVLLALDQNAIPLPLRLLASHGFDSLGERLDGRPSMACAIAAARPYRRLRLPGAADQD